jgi:hypothetical protein
VTLCRWNVVLFLGLAGFAVPSWADVFVGLRDAFEDDTAQGWEVGLPSANVPVNIASGGPAGAGDNYLLLTSSGGGGPGGRLVVFNESQWAGDYVAAGVTGIGLDVNNLGSNSVSLGLYFEDSTGGLPANAAFSKSSLVVPAGSGWMHIVLGAQPDDLSARFGSVTAALSGARRVRLYHGGTASFPGAPIVAQLGIDNVTAVPEPGTSLLLGAGMAVMLMGAVARRFRHA